MVYFFHSPIRSWSTKIRPRWRGNGLELGHDVKHHWSNTTDSALMNLALTSTVPGSAGWLLDRIGLGKVLVEDDRWFGLEIRLIHAQGVVSSIRGFALPPLTV